MGIKFQSPIDLSAHRAIRYNSAAQTLVVTVATKTAAHPEFGNGSTNGFVVDGIEGPYLEFTPGNTYKFDQSDNSNSNHPLRFYEDAAKTTSYTTGVTTNGVPGQSGAYTQIIPTTSVPPILYYQCSNHSLMGSYVKFGTGTVGDTYSINATQDGSNVDLNLDAASGTDSTVQLNAGNDITLTRDNANQVTIASTATGDTYDLNATQDGSNVDINLTSGSGSDNSTVQLTAGSNVTLTRNGAQEVTIAASGGSQGITIQDEGTPLSTLATTLNFTGSGVTASGTGATKTIDVTGGGSGTVTIEKNVYTGNGSTTTFNTSSAIANENNVQIYIDGVYQSKDNYTTSGSTVTMATAPGNGTSVELIQFVSISGNVVAVDNFTGNGSTTAFNLTLSVSNKNNTQVYIDGVYQDKSTYTISGATLTFSPAPGNGAKIEVVHIKASSSGSGSGVSWDSSIQTSNFTATAGEGYFVNTAGGAITVTLPASPSLGDEVSIVDYTGTFATNNLTINPNGNKIRGGTVNKILNANNKALTLVFTDSTEGWVISSAASDDDLGSAPYSIDALIVAGGGGAAQGAGNGGGGAGGLLTGTIANQISGVQYTITVGAGGAIANSGYNTAGNDGSNSSIAIAGGATHTSNGGGRGGADTPATPTANAGGSGGGGGGATINGTNTNGGASNQGNSSPLTGHGNAGGNGTGYNDYIGAGGGGAGAAGGVPSGSYPNIQAGDGGVGLTSTIISTTNASSQSVGEVSGGSVYFAGGGGGAAYSASDCGDGGLGGGADGVTGSNPGNAGTANTGGGGSGTQYGSQGSGGPGGSGVIILKMPTADYSGTITGSPGVVTEGTNTILVFKASGTYTT